MLPWPAGADDTPLAVDDGWPVAAPEDAGFDATALAELTALIDAGVGYPNVHAVLVERHGSLVYEQYWAASAENADLWQGMPGPSGLHDIRSVTKSVTSLLFGIAAGADVERVLRSPVARYLPGRAGLNPRLDAVTVHHALTMTAGLAWNETLVPYFTSRNDFAALIRTPDPMGYVLSKELIDPPGARWVYHSGLTDLVAAIIETLVAEPLERFAQREFFAPLGITGYGWWRPAAWPEGHFPSAGAGLALRGRDMAKIGSLMLHSGLWQGNRIVPAAWIERSTADHVQIGSGADHYGYFWFTGTHLGGPHLITAAGYGDQRIYVLPELDLSVSIFAGNMDRGTRQVGERVLGRVVRALR